MSENSPKYYNFGFNAAKPSNPLTFGNGHQLYPYNLKRSEKVLAWVRGRALLMGDPIFHSSLFTKS